MVSQSVQANLRRKTANVGVGVYITSDNTRTVKECPVTRSIGTQTPIPEPVFYNPHGSPWKVFCDHTYSQPNEKQYPTNQACDLNHDHFDQQPDYTEASESEEEEIIPTEQDPEWIPTDISTESDGAQIPESSTTPTQDKKYIVFGQQLEELLRFCPRCGSPVVEKTKRLNGSLITVNLSCIKNHQIKWQSQPVINNYPMGNVLLSAACLFSGATFTRVHQICEFLGLQVPCLSTFYRHQKNILYPVIAGTWNKEKNKVLSELAAREDGVELIGDGRCDSPGYSAKYGTYTVMDKQSSKIAEFQVVQVTEVSSSVAMEKEGLDRVLKLVKGREPCIRIKTLATDRHTQIAKYMEKEHPDINHQYDLWHFAKNIVSRLNVKAKTKKYAIIGPWIQCISNHLWWCAASCHGNELELREKWTSLVYHITDVHEWDSAKVYHRCEHPPLENEERRAKLWLRAGSPPHKLLQDIIFDEKLLSAVSRLTGFCHTGPLEVAHSLYLKYCPKRQHFSYEGMVARTMLAAMDNNNNVSRAQATVQKGEKAGEERYNLVYPKGRKRWVAKPILEPKDYSFVKGMLVEVERVCSNTCPAEELGSIQVPELPSNISRQEKPDKAEVIANQKSRLHIIT